MIHTLLVDDNKYILKNLENIINNLNTNVKIIGTITNAYDVIPFIENNQVDLVFMDIDLNCKLDGIELVNKINKKYQDIMFIYATAHIERSYDCWKTDAITLGFIDKPFCEQEIKICLKKMVKYVENNRIILKDKYNNIIYVAPKEIVFIEKESKKNTVIHCVNRDIFLTDCLNNIEIKLSNFKNLVRTQKSYITNLNMIEIISEPNETSYTISFKNYNPNRKAYITKIKLEELKMKGLL
jgi:DNA-binding LytR/AlgR family response regulator